MARRRNAWTALALLTLGGVGLAGAAWKQFGRRELLPWLRPDVSLSSWRWQGIKNCPRAFWDEWVNGDPDLRRRKLVALTFDDGPYPLYTPLLLDTLKRYHVKATFFLVGLHVREYPALARRIVADGHEIANHTDRHRRERDLSQQELAAEILGCEATLVNVTGQRPRCFRPAGGNLSLDGIRTVQRLGYTCANETINPGDWWQRDPDLLIRFAYRGRTREGVACMHSGALGTIKALPGYINSLKAKGFSFVTMSELAQQIGQPLPELPPRTPAEALSAQPPSDPNRPGNPGPPPKSAP